jgi:CheY-like chemotaxis protein
MVNVATILIVGEDEPDMPDFRRSLEKMKLICHLETVRSGNDAFDLLREKTKTAANLPDIILVENNLQEAGGLEFISRLRNEDAFRHLKCYLIASPSDTVDRQTAANLGVSGCLPKPLKLNRHQSMDSFNLMIDLMNLQSRS